MRNQAPRNWLISGARRDRGAASSGFVPGPRECRAAAVVGAESRRGWGGCGASWRRSPPALAPSEPTARSVLRARARPPSARPPAAAGKAREAGLCAPAPPRPASAADRAERGRPGRCAQSETRARCSAGRAARAADRLTQPGSGPPPRRPQVGPLGQRTWRRGHTAPSTPTALSLPRPAPARQDSVTCRVMSPGKSARGRRAGPAPSARASDSRGVATRAAGSGRPDVTAAPQPRGIYLRKVVAAAGTGVVERPGGAGSAGAPRRADPSRGDAAAGLRVALPHPTDGSTVIPPHQSPPRRIGPSNLFTIQTLLLKG